MFADIFCTDSIWVFRAFAGFCCTRGNYIGSWDLTQEAFLSVLGNDILEADGSILIGLKGLLLDLHNFASFDVW